MLMILLSKNTPAYTTRPAEGFPLIMKQPIPMKWISDPPYLAEPSCSLMKQSNLIPSDLPYPTGPCSSDPPYPIGPSLMPMPDPLSQFEIKSGTTVISFFGSIRIQLE